MASRPTWVVRGSGRSTATRSCSSCRNTCGQVPVGSLRTGRYREHQGRVRDGQRLRDGAPRGGRRVDLAAGGRQPHVGPRADRAQRVAGVRPSVRRRDLVGDRGGLGREDVGLRGGAAVVAVGGPALVAAGELPRGRDRLRLGEHPQLDRGRAAEDAVGQPARAVDQEGHGERDGDGDASTVASTHAHAADSRSRSGRPGAERPARGPPHPVPDGRGGHRRRQRGAGEDLEPVPERDRRVRGDPDEQHAEQRNEELDDVAPRHGRCVAPEPAPRRALPAAAVSPSGSVPGTSAAAVGPGGAGSRADATSRGGAPPHPPGIHPSG